MTQSPEREFYNNFQQDLLKLDFLENRPVRLQAILDTAMDALFTNDSYRERYLLFRQSLLEIVPYHHIEDDEDDSLETLQAKQQKRSIQLENEQNYCDVMLAFAESMEQKMARENLPLAVRKKLMDVVLEN